MALTALAHRCIRAHFQKSDLASKIAVDATCGNGFDTEFLSRLGFGRVVGFDIQQRAIDITRHRLDSAGLLNADLHTLSHERIGAIITQPIDCAMFNFGYLPRGDKDITTQASSSINAIQAVLSQLTPGGIVSLLCYPGHPAGQVELEEIEHFLDALDQNWRVKHHPSPFPGDSAPQLFLVSPA